MKKKSLLGFVLIVVMVICLGSAIVFSNNGPHMKKSSAPVEVASLDKYNDPTLMVMNQFADIGGPKRNLKDIEDYAKYIVKATIIGEPREIDQFKDDGSFGIGNTVIKVKIEKIYKDDSGLLNDNDVIEMVEPYYIRENTLLSDGSVKDVLCTIEGYLPPQTGEKYILFLEGYGLDAGKDFIFANMYYSVGVTYGRYILPDDKKEAKELSKTEMHIGDQVEDDYKKIFDDVKVKYNK